MKEINCRQSAKDIGNNPAFPVGDGDGTPTGMLYREWLFGQILAALAGAQPTMQKTGLVTKAMEFTELGLKKLAETQTVE